VIKAGRRTYGPRKVASGSCATPCGKPGNFDDISVIIEVSKSHSAAR
jgi:hypothetical protein